MRIRSLYSGFTVLRTELAGRVRTRCVGCPPVVVNSKTKPRTEMEVGESKRKVSQGVVVIRLELGGPEPWISYQRRWPMDVASCSLLSLMNSSAGLSKPHT